MRCCLGGVRGTVQLQLLGYFIGVFDDVDAYIHTYVYVDGWAGEEKGSFFFVGLLEGRKGVWNGV